MSDIVDPKTIGSTPEAISRRDFIKGVIVGGMARPCRRLPTWQTPAESASCFLLRSWSAFFR